MTRGELRRVCGGVDKTQGAVVMDCQKAGGVIDKERADEEMAS